MKSLLDTRLAHRITLVQSLSLLTQNGVIQRHIDNHPLETNVGGLEAECERSAYAEYGYLSSVQKTERFGRALYRVLRAKEMASNFDPVTNRYQASNLIEKLTSLRQWADSHGVPYDFFAVEACRFLINRNNLVDPDAFMDSPELDDFMAEDVRAYVESRWAEPAARLEHPFEPSKWDLRFRARRRHSENQHQALRKLLDQRIADARATGCDAAVQLMRIVPDFMPEAEAVERFGPELVEATKHYRGNELTRLRFE